VVVASGWRFEVTKLDGPRVDRVHVRRAEPGEEGLSHPAEGPAVRRGDPSDADAADASAGGGGDRTSEEARDETRDEARHEASDGGSDREEDRP
jgi:hypothetical protein